jgi:hypothetical protein
MLKKDAQPITQSVSKNLLKEDKIEDDVYDWTTGE